MNINEHRMTEYSRPPTQAEIKFGEGAIHYKDLPNTVCRHPSGELKKWCVCPLDGLRYYRY